MPKWTEEQQSAIDARGCNLLVAAAAGSGKTAVLVERIVQLILKDGVDIDSLLVVTFTNAAAGEMRERIGSALLKAIDGSNGGSEHLRRQLNLLSKASISTIHSFCISVIRKYFNVINLDPGFRIGDETECSLIKLEVLEDLFESEYEKGSEAFLGLVERFSDNRQDGALQELVLNLHAFVQSKPFPRQWLEERIEDFARDAGSMEDSPWCRALLLSIQMEIQGIIDMLTEATDLCRKPYGPAAYEDNLADDINQMNEVLLAGERGGLKACMASYAGVQFSRLKSCGKDVDDELKKRVRDLRDKAKKAWSGLGGGLLSRGLDLGIEQLNELYPYIRCLGELVFEFDRQYKKQKQDRGIIDFNDLEHYALDILQHEEAARELRDKYSYIFIDEYQDSNLVQETILSCICREDNLFMVGDVKQSIYRFRLADSSIFLGKYGEYQPEEGQINRRIDLNRNFRSRAHIINGVNYLFRNIMSSRFGELDYDDKAALYPGLSLPPIDDQVIEVHLVEKNGADDEELDPDIEDFSDVEVEASIAADRIQQLIGTEIYDPKLDSYRKLEYRDIVVLMRSTVSWAPVFQEVFAQRGIPVYADINTGYFDALEVKTIIDLIKIIDNKRQDIPLLTVLRSPIGGFDAGDLIRIRTAAGAKAFYQAAYEYMDKFEDDLAMRLKAFYRKLEGWQEAVRYMPMEDFIWKLYIESGYYYYAGAMPDGVQRQANLRILLERARQFRQTSIKGLFQFIRFVDKLKSTSGDMGVAKTLGENENVLRIMSIHKSKGLEFPVVIVAGLGKKFNLSDTNAAVLFHKDLGLGPKYVNPDTRQTCDTIARIAMKQVIRLESLAEEMRILYVALTRPKDRLILLGSARDLRKTAENWAKPISAYSLSRGTKYLDWIGPVLMRHPDGSILWNMLDDDTGRKVPDDESRWRVVLHSRREAASVTMEDAVNRNELLDRLEKPHEYIAGVTAQPNLSCEKAEKPAGAEGDGNSEGEDSGGTSGNTADAQRLQDMIESRFAWEYPYQKAVNIPSKLTVTEIKKIQAMRLQSDEDAGVKSLISRTPSLITRPRFMEGSRRFSPAEKGTILHFILQHLDLNRVDDREDIKGQIAEMAARQLLTEEEAKAADIDMIHGFLSSETGRRIRNAANVRREVPFNLRKKACDVMADWVSEDTLLIQGVIDCFFEEDGQWVLVDYKTDYVESEIKAAQAAERYRVQMNLYAEALERITGKPVKERILYLLYLNLAVKM